MSQKVSQREAIRLRKRVKVLEAAEKKRFNAYSQEYPGGVNIDHITLNAEEYAIVRTTRLLGHMIVAVPGSNSQLMLFAVKP